MSSAEYWLFHSELNTLWCTSCQIHLNTLYWNIIFGNIEISTSAIGHISKGLLSWCAIFKLSLQFILKYEAPVDEIPWMKSRGHRFSNGLLIPNCMKSYQVSSLWNGHQVTLLFYLSIPIKALITPTHNELYIGHLLHWCAML